MLRPILAFVALVFITIDAHSQDLQRGKMLHDAHCVSCHDSRIYTRQNRVAKDEARLRAEVDRWRKAVSLEWSAEDINAVTAFLGSRYYGIDCSATC